MSTLKDLYFEELKDLYDAELRIAEALPKMADKATSQELERAILKHKGETDEQAKRLEAIFQNHDKKPERKNCKAMKSLLEEGESHLKEWKGEDAVKDAAIIASAQKVEHYEIAGYGTARCFAEILGFDDDVKLLDETLDEEKNTDMKLSDLAQSEVNLDAVEGSLKRTSKEDSQSLSH